MPRQDHYRQTGCRENNAAAHCKPTDLAQKPRFGGSPGALAAQGDSKGRDADHQPVQKRHLLRFIGKRNAEQPRRGGKMSNSE